MQVGNASQLGTWRRSSTEILHRLPVLCPQPHSWVPQADSRLPQDPLKGALGHTALTGEGNSHPSFFPAITEEGGGRGRERKCQLLRKAGDHVDLLSQGCCVFYRGREWTNRPEANLRPVVRCPRPWLPCGCGIPTLQTSPVGDRLRVRGTDPG